jgi:CheY-like chemotaxis protein
MMNNNKAESVVQVVDDETAIRDMAGHILELRGHRVIETSNGTEALALFDDDTPLDLLIADLHMLGLGETQWRAGFVPLGSI